MNKAENFWKDLFEDEKMMGELDGLLDPSKISSEEEKIEIIAGYAVSKGYEVVEEELSFAKAKLRARELPDEVLEYIAAGENPDLEQMCFADYLCIIAWNTCYVSNECKESLWTCNEAVSKGDCVNGLGRTKDCKGVFVSY